MIERLATFLLGIVIVAYWLRVVRMAHKQRRKTGRAANFIPKEKVGRITRLIWNPVVVLWIVLPLVSACLVSPPTILSPVYDTRFTALPGVVIAFACFVATLVCWRKMGANWRMGIDPNERTQLVFGGPYAYVRHPIYALSTLMMLATMLALPSPVMLMVGAIHIALIQWEARREELYLVPLHGPAYADYMANVGGFFPRSLQPYAPTGSSEEAKGVIIPPNAVPINIFQRLVRWWDEVHPYNAIHVVTLTKPVDRITAEKAWNTTLQASGLGRLRVANHRYWFESLADTQPVTQLGPQFCLVDHIQSEMNRPFAAGDIPFRPFAEGNQVGIVYQHWVADATALRLLLEDWCRRLTDDKPMLECQLELPNQGYTRLFSPDRARWDFIEGLLRLTRGFSRMRQVQKVESIGLNQPAVGAFYQKLPDGWISQLHDYARAREIKVNDLLMAAMLETCGQMVPLQRRKSRLDVAVGNVSDLRSTTSVDLRRTFGLFLGLTNAVVRPNDLRDWDRLLNTVARQNRLTRQQHMAPASVLRMAAAEVAGYFSSNDEMYHFFRKEMPLAGGVSNVNLAGTWFEQAQRTGKVTEYLRVSPTGPMVPITLTVTTLGPSLYIGITHRKSLISDELARKITRKVIDRLTGLLDNPHQK